MAFSGFWLVGALTAAPSARLTRRIGTQNVLRTAGAVLIATSSVTALFARSEATFIVFISLGGFAPALAVPAASIVIMAAVPPRHQALALTSASASSAIGLLGAGFLVSTLADQFGWSRMYGLTALMGGVLLVVGLGVHARTTSAIPHPAGSPARLARRGPLLLALFAVGLTNVAIGGATTFIVASAPSSEVGIEQAALATALASTASIPVRILLGFVTDHTGKDPIIGVALLLLAGSAGYLLLGTGTPVAFYVGVGLVLVPGWAWVNVFLYGILARYRDNVAAAVGMVQTTYFIGSVIGPVAVGAFIGATSYEFAWLVLGITTAIGTVLLLLIRPLLTRFDSGRRGPEDLRLTP